MLAMMNLVDKTITMKPQNNEIEEICRLCGDRLGPLVHDIFDNSKDILEKISLCLPIIILPQDLYHKICDTCYEILDTMVNFVNKSISIDRRFRQKKENSIRTVSISSVSLDGPIQCDVCNTFFSDMGLFDKHTEEHKSKMEFMFYVTPLSMITGSAGEIICQKIDAYQKISTFNKRKERTSLRYKLLGNETNNRQVQNLFNPENNPWENNGKIHISTDLINEMLNNVKKSCQEHSNAENNKPTKKQKKLFMCTDCNETFPNNKELKTHSIQIHNSSTNTEWVCKFCNKSMTTKVGLLIHERIHDGSKPYICEWCGNGFRSRANLTQHQVIHTGVRKYPCPRCHKRFSRRSFVETHMRVHTGERPFCCDICGYRFTQIGDMRRHRNKHQNYPTFISSNIKQDPGG